jgi:Fe-S oxidoreductase
MVNLFPHDEDALRLHRQTFLLSEFLTQQVKDYQPPKLRRKAIVHAHCHHKAIMGTEAEQEILKRLGLDFELLDDGCCGMAGSFGFEKDHYDVSLAVGELKLLPTVREADADTLIVTNGFSCREQIEQTTERQPLHLAQLIQMALHQERRKPSPDRPHGQIAAGPAWQHCTATEVWLGAGAAALGGYLCGKLCFASHANGRPHS